jgi:hypothetical protein
MFGGKSINVCRRNTRKDDRPSTIVAAMQDQPHIDQLVTAEHLELAQWHVDSGSGLIRRQREIVLQLEREGRPVEEARVRLSELEQAQQERIRRRDRIAVLFLGAP